MKSPLCTILLLLFFPAVYGQRCPNVCQTNSRAQLGVQDACSRATGLSDCLIKSCTGRNGDPGLACSDPDGTLSSSFTDLSQVTVLVSFDWPQSPTLDLDTQVTFLTSARGSRSCVSGGSDFITFSGDSAFNNPIQESYTVAVGEANVQGLWSDSTQIDLFCDWFAFPDPADVTISIALVEGASSQPVAGASFATDITVEDDPSGGCATPCASLVVRLSGSTASGLVCTP
ncbi:hypothetical protein FGB62_189g017 [Gracilaria domingensis]|nr:hypothetical protein FGB62_189g017 [Gracilaria domingensis]